MQQLEALIFDLEGTIVDSTIDIELSLNTLLKEEGRPSLTPKQAQNCITEGLMDTCRNAFMATGSLNEDDLYPYVKRLVEHIRTAKASEKQVYANVRTILETYQKLGVKMAICTNKNEEATIKQLTELNLINYFDFIAGGNTFMVHKPNPGHITGILDKLNILPEHTLFIGDSHTDLMACANAKIPCIMITHGSLDPRLDNKAAAQIAEFDELEACVKKLGYKA